MLGSVTEDGLALLQEGGRRLLGVRVLGELGCHALLLAVAVAQAHGLDGVERLLGDLYGYGPWTEQSRGRRRT